MTGHGLCGSCGAWLGAGALSCPSCGWTAPVEAREERPAPACLRCTAPNPPAASFCASCGESLLVDVSVASPLARPVAYAAARALVAELPGTVFTEVQARLLEGGVVFRGVTREVAQTVMGVLAGKGAQGRLDPAGSTGEAAAKPRRLPVVARVVLSVTIAAAVVVVVLVVRAGAQGVRLAMTAGSTLGSRSASSGPEGVPAGVGLTPEEVKASSAAVKCKSSEGAGFFVSPTTLITNAHVVCPPGEPMSVLLADGRRLLARLEKQDPWLDLAVLDVPGAAGRPLPVGDASTLKEGDPVLMIGNPHGMEFTIHHAAISFVGRNHLGIAYLQFDGSVNPGNSGGPLIDREGRVVGVVSMKVMKAERLGLALPINYLYQGEVPMGVDYRPEVVSEAWPALLARVAAEDAREVAEARAGLNAPALLGVRGVVGRGAAVVVMIRSAQRPRALRVPVAVRDEKGATLCAETVVVEKWSNLEERTQDMNLDRMATWATRNHLGKDLYVGAGLFAGTTCLRPGVEVVLPYGEKGSSSVRLE